MIDGSGSAGLTVLDTCWPLPRSTTDDPRPTIHAHAHALAPRESVELNGGQRGRRVWWTWDVRVRVHVRVSRGVEGVDRGGGACWTMFSVGTTGLIEISSVRVAFS